MKSKKFPKRAVCLLFMIIMTLLSTFAVSAVVLDGDGIDDDVVVTDDPYVVETTVYVEPETEPYVEPTQYVEPETEPYVETTVYVEPVTEAPQVQTEQQTQYVEPEVQSTTTYIDSPTVSKTVSQKKYTTNYTAGIVSWICVGVGVLVVAVVLISNKVSGRANRKR